MFGKNRTVRLIGSVVPIIALFVPLAGLRSEAEAVEVTFRFRPAEEASMVTVAGTFNDWSTTANPLADPDEDGVWETTLDLYPGNHQYKFVVDGSNWITDEYADDFADDGYGGKNSILVVGDEAVVAGEPMEKAAEPKGTPVTFRFRPPKGRANAVSLAGTFNDWNAAAHLLSDQDGDGVWEVTLHLDGGEYAYQFVVDGEEYFTDPEAERYEPDGFGGRNALLTVE